MNAVDSLKAQQRELALKMISDMLNKCSPMQILFFNKIFPGDIPDDKLYGAIDLIERTIIKNEKDSARLS